MTNPLFLWKPIRNWFDKSTQKQLEAQVILAKFPVHLGLILDGNRRFAMSIGVAKKQGYAMGIQHFHDVLKWCFEYHIRYVSIWVFSTENWQREEEEVNDVTELFLREAESQLKSGEFARLGVQFKALGDYSKFPKKLQDLLHELETITESGQNLTLNVCIGYGGQQEIVDSVNSAVTANPGKAITAEMLTEHSYLGDQPTPDLIIRTSGEHRHSGFLLWHSPYAEYFFSSTFWPAWSKVDFLTAMLDYQKRNRRFGK